MPLSGLFFAQSEYATASNEKQRRKHLIKIKKGVLPLIILVMMRFSLTVLAADLASIEKNYASFGNLADDLRANGSYDYKTNTLEFNGKSITFQGVVSELIIEYRR